MLFSKISYPQIYCALVLKKVEGAFFIEIFAYRWTNAEKMSVEKQEIFLLSDLIFSAQMSVVK